ncbi:MAG: hypothetical protein KDC11_13900, partial [Chitinophagaceae bacterium]|nr:hypothetical protein [Chitinophagaceae bacterium]
MNKLFSLALAVCVSATAFAQNKIESIAIGSDIPMVGTSMKAADGNDVSLNDIKTDNGLRL